MHLTVNVGELFDAVEKVSEWWERQILLFRLSSALCNEEVHLSGRTTSCKKSSLSSSFFQYSRGDAIKCFLVCFTLSLSNLVVIIDLLQFIAELITDNCVINLHGSFNFLRQTSSVYLRPLFGLLCFAQPVFGLSVATCESGYDGCDEFGTNESLCALMQPLYDIRRKPSLEAVQHSPSAIQSLL